MSAVRPPRRRCWRRCCDTGTAAHSSPAGRTSHGSRPTEFFCGRNTPGIRPFCRPIDTAARLATRPAGNPVVARGEIAPCTPIREPQADPLSGEVNMTDKNSGPAEGVKGAVEDVKGKAKEAVGTVAGRNDLVDEGKAQQDKADAQQDAAKKEAEAEAARGSAKAAEKRQEANQ